MTQEHSASLDDTAMIVHHFLLFLTQNEFYFFEKSFNKMNWGSEHLNKNLSVFVKRNRLIGLRKVSISLFNFERNIENMHCPLRVTKQQQSYGYTGTETLWKTTTCTRNTLLNFILYFRWIQFWWREKCTNLDSTDTQF